LGVFFSFGGKGGGGFFFWFPFFWTVWGFFLTPKSWVRPGVGGSPFGPPHPFFGVLGGGVMGFFLFARGNLVNSGSNINVFFKTEKKKIFKKFSEKKRDLKKNQSEKKK